MKPIGSAEIIEGTIQNVIYRNESNDYTVMEVGTSDDELVVAVGSMPMMSSLSPSDPCLWRLRAKW